MKPRIVIVTDDPERLDFVGRWLACEGYNVVMIAGGDLARQARLHRADYVLRPGKSWLT